MTLGEVKKTMYPLSDDMTEKLVYKDLVQVSLQPADGGQRMPTSRSFGILVGIYKVILVLATIFIGTAVALIMLACVVISDRVHRVQQIGETDPLTEQEAALIDQFQSLLPLAIPVLMFYAADLSIGWIAATTLRLRYLRIDLYLQVFVLALGIVAAILSPCPRSLIGIVCQVGEVCLLQAIIDEIRKVNA